MKTALLKRLKRLEQARIVEDRLSVEFQMGTSKSWRKNLQANAIS
jgi:hypothetical protein